MRRFGRVVLVFSLLGFIPAASYAQDKLDFDSLLQDLDLGTSSTQQAESPAPNTKKQPAVVQPVATAPEQAQVSEPKTPAAEAQQPAAEQPAVEETAATQPAAAQPAMEAPAATQPAAAQPAMEAPTVAQPAAPAPKEEFPTIEETPVELMPEQAVEAAAPEATTSEAAAPEAPAQAAAVEAPEEKAAPQAPEAPAEAVTKAAPPEEPAPPAEKEAVVAAPAPAPKAASTKAQKNEARRIARILAQQEEVKRQALEKEGRESLEKAFSALKAGKYEEASKAFEKAVNMIPLRPQTESDILRARWGLAEANYRQARKLVQLDQLTAARQRLTVALKNNPEHRAAARLMKKIEKIEAMPPRHIPASKLPETLAKKKTVEDYLQQGREYFWLGDYTKAESFFESALATDQYNKEAMRFLKKIAELKFKTSTLERQATTKKMIQEVRDAWNLPVQDLAKVPSIEETSRAISKKTKAQMLEEKMSQIIIPSIEFRSVNIRDVVNFLVEASVAGDPEGVGVNIILNLSGGPQGASAGTMETQTQPQQPETDFGFGEEAGGGNEAVGAPAVAPAAPTSAASVPTITLNLRRVSLFDAIRYITDVANLKYRIDQNAVIITPAGVVSDRIISRIYPVQPSIVDVIIQRQEQKAQDRTGEFVEIGGKGTTFERGDVKDFFIKAGVPFPVGTSIVYNPAISSLIVANTAENLEIFERILSQLNVMPSQVEIEARFIEVSESDLRELGLEWTITDNIELAEQKGIGPAATKKRLQIDADSEGVTKGVRFFGAGSDGTIDRVAKGATAAPSFIGDILSISSVLTNPELNVILHALDQKGDVDVLSAPRVTTKSGQNAVIQVVEEIIYPTEFETNVQTISGGQNVSDRQVVTVTPGSFETRETGVILNVTPTVGPDGYTVELVLAPEVAELIGWLNYGYAFEGTDVAIPQPIFSSRNVTTSIVIWDGQTVVMGGLITEKMLTIDDKIPILGDIPLLGRLFHNKGTKSEKRNLLIFVTARVVDPAGNPVHKANVAALPGTTTVSPGAQALAKP